MTDGPQPHRYLYTDVVTFELGLADEVQSLAQQCGMRQLCGDLERELRLVMLHLRSQQVLIRVRAGGDDGIDHHKH